MTLEVKKAIADKAGELYTLIMQSMPDSPYRVAALVKVEEVILTINTGLAGRTDDENAG